MTDKTAAAAAPADDSEKLEFIEKTNATLNVGGDKLKPKLAELVESKDITAEQADLIWWYFAYAKDGDWSLRRAATEIGVDQTTIYRVFNCIYGAKLDNICSRIARFKRTVEVRGNINDIPYVETSIGRKVGQVCQASWASQSIAMIWGESQTGKTYALEHFTRTNNHGTTKYVRLPAKGGIQMVAKEFAKACYVSADSSFEGIRDRILKAVDSSNLVIVDEVHEAFISYQKTSAVSILEFFREIHDRTKCGMVLCMTNIGRDEIEKGKLSPVLKQLSRRGVIKLQLPDLAPESDFLLIAAKAFKLPRPEREDLEIVRTIRHQNGLGVFCHYLKMGARLAKNLGQTYAWSHFATAYNTLTALSDKSASGGSK
jgi:DNA transposition AAA+ family ATPase